ncbi:hypothetical protein [Motilimonas eburnea]|uniref:hypothetical protein n=1 Tax=Motilimonas eburnea TaxID=1737488 RepID=UPI001E600B1A|nr:hypothetical protein [Motilimonas eburnea]MCE2573747.1 hypothetical protein [Motilimonas eburnea]
MKNLLLVQILDEELLATGFERSKCGIPIYKRTVNGNEQILGLRKGSSSSKEYSVYFEVPEEEHFYELSPLCPLKNSYWWPEELAASQERELRGLIKNVALVYFKSKGRTVLDGISEVKRLLENEKTPFKEAEECLWRVKGDLIEIVDFELLANDVFCYIYVTSWHKDLLDVGEEIHPENISRVASQTVAQCQIDSEPNTTIYSYESFEMGTSGVAKRVNDTIIGYFDSINTIDDVKRNIRKEYRYHFA